MITELCVTKKSWMTVLQVMVTELCVTKKSWMIVLQVMVTELCVTKTSCNGNGTMCYKNVLNDCDISNGNGTSLITLSGSTHVGWVREVWGCIQNCEWPHHASQRCANRYENKRKCCRIFTAVTMKNAFFWDVTPCGSCKNRRFGGSCHLHLQGRKHPRAKKSVSSWLTYWTSVRQKKSTNYAVNC
jgi:hypothetical protein